MSRAPTRREALDARAGLLKIGLPFDVLLDETGIVLSPEAVRWLVQRLGPRPADGACGRMEARLLTSDGIDTPEPFTLHGRATARVENGDDGQMLLEVAVEGLIWVTDREWDEARRTLEALATRV